jgi:diguanylate cyclase (GGDEF)-like protein
MTDLQKQLEAAGVPEDLRRQVAGLEEAAVRDPLTGLYNRRFFDGALARARAAAERYKRELALILFDLDDLKTINDSKGHTAGDTALKAFAQALAETARAADIVCRIGGDEFAVILPETNEVGAQAFAQRAVENPESRSASFGVAALPGDLFADADASLLAAKRG